LEFNGIFFIHFSKALLKRHASGVLQSRALTGFFVYKRARLGNAFHCAHNDPNIPDAKAPQSNSEELLWGS